MRAVAITLAGGAAVLGMVGMADAQSVKPVATRRSGDVTMNYYSYNRLQTVEESLATKRFFDACLDCAAHGFGKPKLVRRNVSVSRFEFVHRSGNPFVLKPEAASAMLRKYCGSLGLTFRASSRGTMLEPKALAVHSIDGKCS